jgi:hypothetical protein
VPIFGQHHCPEVEVLPLLFLLLIILIATVGFWDTLGAILGAVAMVVLLTVLVVASVAVAGMIVVRRMRRD